MELFLVIGFALCLVFCALEIYHERDWPRDTFPYLLAMSIAIGIWTFAVN